jgi:5-hydroxyisourate hydrolase-like protein (transthyretin family)
MILLLKRIAAGLLTGVVGGSLLLTAGTASATAERALSVRIENIAPNPVVVKDNQETSVSIDVRTKDAVRVELRVRPVSNRLRTLAAKEPKFAHEGDLWRFTTSFGKNDPEGRWLAIATAYDKDGKSLSDRLSFAVQHVAVKVDTRITHFNAYPGAVRKGHRVYFSGRLQFWDGDHWRGFKGQEVQIYFRRLGTSAFKWVASSSTDRRGEFSARTRAFRSGEYRAVFEGGDHSNGSQSRTDFVRVYRR